MYKKCYVVLVMLILWSFPLFVFGQTKDFTKNLSKNYQGVVKAFVSEDIGVSADYSFKLLVNGSFLELDSSVDWGKYVNRLVSLDGRFKLQKDGLRVLKVEPKSIATLDSPLYVDMTLPPTSQGDYKVISVVVSVQQPGSPPVDSNYITAAQALAPVFHNPKSARVFMDVASSGRLKIVGYTNRIEGDVAFVTINSQITNCQQQQTSEWLTLIDDGLRAQSIEPNNYNATILTFNNLAGCSTQSIATFGNIGMMNSREWVITNKNDMTATWANEMATHELGHTLGLQHSKVYQCTDQNNIPSSCAIFEYGDKSCFMGTGQMLPNVYQRRRLGWHNQPFKQPQFSGRYNVYSPSVFSSPATKRLMSCQFCFIPLSGSLLGSSEYIEARRDYPLFDIYDQQLRAYRDGVKIIVGTDQLADFDAIPYIVDTTPFDTTTNNAPLVLQSYSVAGVVVSHVSITNITGGSGIVITLP